MPGGLAIAQLFSKEKTRKAWHGPPSYLDSRVSYPAVLASFAIEDAGISFWICQIHSDEQYESDLFSVSFSVSIIISPAASLAFEIFCTKVRFSRLSRLPVVIPTTFPRAFPPPFHPLR